jgi:hypothetical protein
MVGDTLRRSVQKVEVEVLEGFTLGGISVIRGIGDPPSFAGEYVACKLSDQWIGAIRQNLAQSRQ